MSVVIENCAGDSHILVTPSDSDSPGFFAVEPEIEATEGSRVLIMGASADFVDIVQPSITLDDKRTLYVFGSAWHELRISGLLLLGQAETNGDVIEKLIEWYDKNKVSEKKEPIDVSMGTAGLDGFVVGMNIGDPNPVVNTLPFTVRLMTADTAK